MIAAIDIVIDPRLLHKFPALFIDNKIIESPTDILRPSTRPHAPPRILHFSWVQRAETVDPSVLQEFREACPLFESEPGCFFIAFWSGNVDLLVADVQIAADYGCLL